MKDKIISLVTKNKILLIVAIVFLVFGIIVGRKSDSKCHFSDHNPSEHEIHNEGDEHEGEGEHEEHAEEGEHEDVVKLSEQTMKEFGIEVGTAEPCIVKVSVTLPGEIVVNADNMAHIIPRVSGIVREVKAGLGDSVRKGQILAFIDSRELANAKAAYLSGLERLELAEANFNREEKLWSKKISSEQEYLDTKQVLAEARIQLRSAEQKLHALGFSHEYLKKLPFLPDEEFIRYEIIAPFDGTITKKHITLGEVVGDNSEIFEVADLSTIWVNLTVYQKNLTSVRTGQQVVIRAAQTGAEASGVIDYVSPIMDESTRTATARIVLENHDGRWLPGMFITGQVNIEDVNVSLGVPRSAIQTIDGKKIVFVKTQEGFEPYPVKVGRADNAHIEIVSGLKAGQRFATTNIFTLKAELGKESFGGHHH